MIHFSKVIEFFYDQVLDVDRLVEADERIVIQLIRVIHASALLSHFFSDFRPSEVREDVEEWALDEYVEEISQHDVVDEVNDEVFHLWSE